MENQDHSLLLRQVYPLKSGTSRLFPGKGTADIYLLYPGITLFLLELQCSEIPVFLTPDDEQLEINYCRLGALRRTMSHGKALNLEPGDFSVHAPFRCTGEAASLPSGFYEGVSILLDIPKILESPPELIRDSGILPDLPDPREWGACTCSVFPGGEKTDSIFAALCDLPEVCLPAYLKLKVQELLIYLCSFHVYSGTGTTYKETEQQKTVREIHEYLMQHLDSRISIEELARKFHMNATTMKTEFKSVYGDSLAAHMKAHRMKRAEELLIKTDSGICDIAKAVGYESQSKFSAVFREFYGCSPTRFRKAKK